MDTEDWVDVGVRVAEARRARGLSQEKLARAMELDRTAIAKIETGRRQINSLELVKLSQCLQRPLSWFVSPPPPVIASRRAANVEQRSDTAGEYALADALRDLRTLTEARTLRPKPAGGPLQPFAAEDHDAVRFAAARARAVLGADATAPLHMLADQVERVGLYVWTLPLGDQALDGAYAAYEPLEGAGVAVINSSMDAGRRRATLAHELGHHLLSDSHSTDWGVNTGDTERAIDAFAATLLLPPGITGRWSGLRQDHSVRQSAILIAAEYRVSWSTALRQLRAYDLLSAEDRHRLDSRSPTRADYLECAVRVVEELQGLQVSQAVKAAAVRAYRTHKISAARALEIIHDDSLSREDLGEPDTIPLEALWGEIGTDPK